MHNRKFLIKQNANILAEQNAWSTAYTEAYLAGRHHHRLGKPLGAYARVGIDEYALGYRAGYFERKNPESTKVQTLIKASEMAETPVSDAPALPFALHALRQSSASAPRPT
jgi:hypothetical protein